MMERKWRIYITIVLLIVTYPTVYYSLINSIDYHHLQVNKSLSKNKQTSNILRCVVIFLISIFFFVYNMRSY